MFIDITSNIKTGVRYIIRGPEEYTDPFECMPTPYSTYSSPFISLYTDVSYTILTKYYCNIG